MKKLILFLLIVLTVFSCKKTVDTKINHKNEYAKNFSIETQDNQLKILSAGNIIHLPLNYDIKRCIITTTSACAYIDVLGKSNTIVGVCSPEYFYNQKIAEGIKNQSIQNVGNDGTLNFEKILALKPDLIITAHNPNYEKILNQLSQQGIKIIYVEEYMELHPLGKTEYLNLFGTLFQQNERADSLYTSIKEKYLLLKDRALQVKNKPTVFTNIMYGDAWYMAGGKSFIATMFNDAGAQYLWKDNQETGTIPLSFEEVFSKAKKADYWIGASNFKSKIELLNAGSNYEWFEAYKKGNVYTTNNQENQIQANDYYESGSIYADKVLSDVIKVIHPELLPEYELTYLKKLQ